MTVVRRSIEVPVAVSEAEGLWYDVGTWPAWVDGFGAVSEVRDPWPMTGGRLMWNSSPYGRGHVSEQVTYWQPGVGQTSDVEDERMTAVQSVAFDEVPGGARVTLELDYAIKQSRPWTALVDVLFIRRAMGDSLRRTLEAFERELAPDAGGPGQGDLR